MYRLCYISTARQPIDQSMCTSILDASRANNERDGITGLLIAGHRRFLQALEGPKPAVDTAFARIQRDPRHFACVPLAQREVPQREFPLWSMGFEQVDDRLAAISGPQLAASAVGRISDPDLRAQFEGFLTLQWRGDRAA